MYNFECRTGAVKNIGHMNDKLQIYVVTPKSEIHLYSAINQGIVLKPEPKLGELNNFKHITPHKLLKIYIQRQSEKSVINYHWYVNLDGKDTLPTTIYSMGKTRVPLFFSGTCKILTKGEVIIANLLPPAILNTPETKLIEELVVIQKTNPKTKLRKIGIRRNNESLESSRD